METKWYSDFKELCISPFKTGIPQIVAYGSCMKGFYGAAAVSVVGSLLTTFIPALIISMMQLHHTFYGRIFVMSANGGVAMQLAFNLFLTFLGLLICWLNKFRLTHQVHREIPIRIKKEISTYRIIDKGKSSGSCKGPKLSILIKK